MAVATRRLLVDRSNWSSASAGCVIAGYAHMHGMLMDQVFVERGGSSSKPLAERREGGKVLVALRPDDTVITPKLDRMFRARRAGQHKIDSIPAMIHLGRDATGNGFSKPVFTIQSAVAEAKRARASQADHRGEA